MKPSGQWKMSTMADDSVERMRSRLVELEAVLAEERGAPDPVAQRRVVDALRVKARVLERLERYAECVAVWDELVDLYGSDPAGDGPLLVAAALCAKAVDQSRSGQAVAVIETADQVVERCQEPREDGKERLLAGHALALKRDALTALRRIDEACVVDSQIIRRFGGAEEPELHGRVAFALVHRAHTHLRWGRVDEALRDSEELIRRFCAEDDAAVRERIANLMLSQARSFIRVGDPDLASITATVLTALAGGAGEAAVTMIHRLRLDRVPGAHGLRRVGESSAMRVVGRARVVLAFTDSRRRASQTLRIARVIIDRLEIEEEIEREQIVASARITEAIALVILGHFREGLRRFEQLTDSGREAVAEAFRRNAALAPEHGPMSELGAISSLAQRAITLGQGDARIARIAFEESMRPEAPESPTSRTAAWIGRLIGP